jgi:hypothetical protein
LTPGLAKLTEEKLAHLRRDLGGVGLQREVPGIEEAHHRARDVAFECLRARGQEERIILSPYGEQRRLVVAEIFLEGRVKRDVSLIVTE